MTLDQLSAKMKMKCNKCGKRPERYYPAKQRHARVCSKLLDSTSQSFGSAAAYLVHAHVGLLQPIYKRFPLGSDLCLKRGSDSFVEPEELVDRH
jgi:hypothetical protein